MRKVRGVTPDYEKMQADSSHQQQQQWLYQKVLLGHRSGIMECYSKVNCTRDVSVSAVSVLFWDIGIGKKLPILYRYFSNIMLYYYYAFLIKEI